MKTLLALALLMAAYVQTPPTVYKPGNGVSLPRVIKQVKAEYTKEAMDQRIEGKVLLDVVVQNDGAVGDVKVAQSLDSVYGLDQQAIKATKQWQFTPGMKDGKPVAVAITIEIAFTLK